MVHEDKDRVFLRLIEKKFLDQEKWVASSVFMKLVKGNVRLYLYYLSSEVGQRY